MASTQDHSKPKGGSSDQVLTWRVWLPRRRPLLSVGIALFVVALPVAVAYFYDSRFYPLLTLLVLVAAVSSHYVPIYFQLDAEGITVMSIWGRRIKPWAKIKTYYPNGDDGVSVSPAASRGLLAVSRDIYLYFEDNREAVLRYLTRYLSPAKRNQNQ